MKKFLPPLGMALLFIVSQLIAVSVAPSFKNAGMEAFENPKDPMNIVQIFIVLLFFTIFILLMAKYKERMVKYIILFFFFTASISIFQAFFFLIIPSISTIIALIVAIIMIILLIYHPEWYVIDTFSIFIAGGIAAIFAISLSIEYIIIFLIALAIYDAISVYRTKHMVTLAKSITSSNLPLLLMVPKKVSFSYMKSDIGGDERDAVYVGLGDFIIPGILITASYMEKGWIGFSVTLAGALLGYAILMRLIEKGPQPGLPYLNGFALLAYLLLHLP